MERGGGGEVRALSLWPQVYQSLLSQVIDVKYGCFTFPFSDCTQRQRERNIDLSKDAVKLLEPCNAQRQPHIWLVMETAGQHICLVFNLT